MAVKKKRKVSNAIVERMIALAGDGCNCSQIIMKLGLEREGKTNPDLIRTVYGLGDGCGFSNETCGILTGSACLLSWYAGRQPGDEKPSEMLLPMLQELGEWFDEEIRGRYKSTRCKDIVGDLIRTPEGNQICGGLLLKTYAKTHEILASYDLITP